MNYQPIAVEAAELELARHNLAPEEIHAGKLPLLTKQLQDEKQKETVKIIGKRKKAKGQFSFSFI